jgi:acyl-CoA synthetase (AMP-forming)/AMP-acid ligase II
MSMLIGNTVGTKGLGQPDALAATLGEREISVRALDAATNRMTRAITESGVGRGDIVMWWTGPSTMDALAGMLACGRLGAIFAPVSALLSTDEVARIAEYARPSLVVCDGERFDAGGEIAGARAALLDASAGAGPAPAGDANLGRRAALASDAALRDTGVAETDPHILYLTSGSTGTPKGVLVSHRASWLRSWPETGAARPDGVLCTFPLYHYGGWHYVIEAWLHGTAVHLVEKADGPQVAEAIERRRPQAIYCIPAVWERVLAEDGDFSSIVHADTGTSAFASDLIARIRSRLPETKTRVLYGASEAGRMAALEHADIAQRQGSVGRAVGAGAITIADDGEVIFSGPTVMNGYLHMPEATAAAMDGGAYRTGDLGRWDADGFLYITGRKTEAIRTGGEWVSPVEVEAAIGIVPGVSDLAVIGVPDSRWGDVVCLAVVPGEDTPPPTVDDLHERLAGLARHKHPRRVVVVDEIPRTTATGQIVRRAIRDQVMAQLEHETRTDGVVAS